MLALTTVGASVGINIRQKGAEGEREIYKALNPIIQKVMRELDFPAEQVAAAATAVQRNQNQSAVGGNDLTNTFGMSIEVKRQEQLAINAWWKQCCDAATRNDEHPVLLYRQNGKKWRCVTTGYVELPSNKFSMLRVEFDWDAFLAWFEQWARVKLQAGSEVRT
jgi:hypothetical protein